MKPEFLNQHIRDVVAQALAHVQVPDLNFAEELEIYNAFQEVWDTDRESFEGWFATFQAQVSTLSNGTVKLVLDDPATYRRGIKGPALYCRLIKGDLVQNVIIGPYDTPVIFVK